MTPAEKWMNLTHKGRCKALSVLLRAFGWQFYNWEGLPDDLQKELTAYWVEHHNVHV